MQANLPLQDLVAPRPIQAERRSKENSMAECAYANDASGRSQTALTTAASATDVCSRWITIATGSATV